MTPVTADAAPAAFRAEAEKSACRVLHFGVAYADFRRAVQAGSWDAWAADLGAAAARYEEQGDRAMATGAHASAAEAWRRAAACHHYAQIKLFPGTLKDDRRAAVRRSFAKAAAYLDPPAHALELDFEGARFPGYVRTPATPDGCVLLVNGLDSAKEVELAHFAEGFLRRGLAVFFFDGPGQGTRPGGLPMTRFAELVSRVVDVLAERPATAGVPFAIFGVSFGGHLACRAAALEPRLQACVSLGGFHDARILSRLPAPAHPALRAAYALDPDAPLDALEAEITLAPLRGRLERPLLVVHGSADHLVDSEQIDALRAWPARPAKVRIYEGAEHVCTDRFAECLPELWDWTAVTLRAVAGRR